MTDVAVELRDFLKSRRGRLRPADVGVVAYGDRRRVPGLRREELAQLAGVSITHYTRLDQGNGASVSDEVLDAIAGALRLNDHERAYLHRVARACGGGKGVANELPELRPSLVELLDSLVLIPAVIIGHHTEVVRFYRLFVEVYGPAPATFSGAIFLDPDGIGRRIAPSWDLHASFNVAMLRASMARRPGDERLREHVARMRSLSPEFDDRWQQHDVVEPSFGEAYMVLDHPTAGRMVLNYEHLLLPGDPDLHGLHLWTAEPGTGSHTALRVLAKFC